MIMNADLIKERNKMIEDLEQIFSLALIAEDYKAAIQAKQMICKVSGFMDADKSTFSLVELTQAELDFLINQSEIFKANNK